MLNGFTFQIVAGDFTERRCGDNIMPIYVTSVSLVVLHFHSDGIVGGYGFELQYFVSSGDTITDTDGKLPNK